MKKLFMLVFITLLFYSCKQSKTYLLLDDIDFEKEENEFFEDIYNYDVIHMDIFLDVTDTLNKKLYAKSSVKAIAADRDLDYFVADLYKHDSLKIKSINVSYGDENVIIAPEKYKWEGRRILAGLPFSISKDDTFNVSIEYYGEPHYRNRWYSSGLKFKTYQNTAVIEAKDEPEGTHRWLACKDIPKDKFTMDLRVRTWKHHTVASNGLKMEEKIDNDKKITHWKEKYPIATYLIGVYVAKYVVFKQEYTALDGKTKMDIVHYVYPDRLEHAKKGFAKVPEMLSFLASKLGEYPFLDEKYGTAMTIYLGMEHQTISAMGYRQIYENSKAENWLIFHEIVHHWLGNQVGIPNWRETWFKEGLASYMESLWNEYSKGVSPLEYLHKEKSLKFTEQALEGCNPCFDRVVYQKGAWIYHMLMKRLGEEEFFRILRKFLHNSVYTYDVATGKQFFDFIKNETGTDYSYFYNNWIKKGNNPEYKFLYDAGNTGNGSVLKLDIIQEQVKKGAQLFMDDIAVRIKYINNRDTLLMLKNNNENQTYNIQLPDKIREISSEDFNFEEYSIAKKKVIHKLSID